VRLTALVLTIAVSSAASVNDVAMQMLEHWILSVQQHAAGQSDPALARLTALTHDDLDVLRGYVEALVELPPNTRDRGMRRRLVGGDLPAIKDRINTLRLNGNFDEFKKRAAILHTDAAILGSPPVVIAPAVVSQRKPRWRSGDAEPSVDVKSFDGRVERYELANPHWQFAMDLLDALPAKPQRDAMVAQWYRAIGAHFAWQHAFADSLRHFDRARSVVPDDPDVLFGEACFQETLGSPRVQNLQRVTTLPNGLIIRGVESPGTHHRRAEVLLKRALAARPDFIDARLRLGRVLSEQRQFEAALAHFAQVVADSDDLALTYYANLFAGDAALALGRPAESRASYERALRSHPLAQSARLGLAAALRAAGDRAAALDAVMTTVSVPVDERDTTDDPWWVYYEGDANNVERLRDELRAPFRKPGR
jgi:tetratricopeptide (TPR) repeat protein